MLLFDDKKCISVVLKNKNRYVALAAEDMRQDFARVSEAGHLPKLCESECDFSIIIEENSPSADCESEDFSIQRRGERLYIKADSYLGTMWGIYTLCDKILGVDPCYIFNDLAIEKKRELHYLGRDIFSHTEGFKLRGIFINDEDLLTGWKECSGLRHQPTRWYKCVPPSSVIDMVVETALRLKLNLIIPASFLDIANPAEKALADAVARRGIFISQHHVEPLGVSAYTFDNYFKGHAGAKYSYFENPELFFEIWQDYARRWSEYDCVVWQLGLRGVGDRPIWQEAVPTEQELCNYGRAISEVYEKQKQIILDATGGRAKYFTSTLWMEGSRLIKSGHLTLPHDVIAVYSDSGPNQCYCNDFYSASFDSDRHYGIYYHLQYYGCGPHLVPETGLDKLYYHARLAYDRGLRDYFIMNASNMREFVFELAAYAEMAWSIGEYSSEDYMRRYCNIFGEQNETLRELVCRYFDELPELDISLLSVHLSNYFDYHTTKLPAPLKSFIAKDGIITGLGGKLLDKFEQGFCKPFPTEMYINVYNSVKTALPKYEKLARELSSLADALPERLGCHIKRKWLLYTVTLVCIYKWYIALVEAKDCYEKHDDGEAVRSLTSAREALAAYLTYRKCAEYGEFENWYRGDTKLNIPQLLADTDFLLGRTPNTY